MFRVAITRGLYGAFARALGRVFPRDNGVLLSVDGAPSFRVALDDGYWTRFALWHDQYEPEVGAILRAASGATDLFLDLGANKGYWTLRAAPLFARIVAVEASAETFNALQANTRDVTSVTRYHRAVAARSNQALTFVNVRNSHASARLVLDDGPEAEGTTETVETICIDELVPSGTAAVIKLDVEGAEIAALSGATRSLQDGSVVIYEDHGSDPACRTSAYLLEQPDIAIYAVGESLIPLLTVEQVRGIKKDIYKGYNFIAARRHAPLIDAISKSLSAVEDHHPELSPPGFPTALVK